MTFDEFKTKLGNAGLPDNGTALIIPLPAKTGQAETVLRVTPENIAYLVHMGAKQAVADACAGKETGLDSLKACLAKAERISTGETRVAGSRLSTEAAIWAEVLTARLVAEGMKKADAGKLGRDTDAALAKIAAGYCKRAGRGDAATVADAFRKKFAGEVATIMEARKNATLDDDLGDLDLNV